MSGDEPERVDPYIKKRGFEPTNCLKGNSIQASDPYKEAGDHIKKNPASNCCTIDVNKNVTQWKLPNNTKVQLCPADGITFYYDSGKLPLD